MGLIKIFSGEEVLAISLQENISTIRANRKRNFNRDRYSKKKLQRYQGAILKNSLNNFSNLIYKPCAKCKTGINTIKVVRMEAILILVFTNSHKKRLYIV